MTEAGGCAVHAVLRVFLSQAIELFANGLEALLRAIESSWKRRAGLRLRSAMLEGSKVCVDVDYRAASVVAACVGFEAWDAASPSFEKTLAFAETPAAYESGQFFRRELPYLLALLRALEQPPALVVVDGFVWLDGGRPGLGAHLAEALGGGTPVIGVAKRPFHDSTKTSELLRGSSQVPLFVSSTGMELADAVACIAAMHGPHRIPTLLKRVDQLSRGRP